MEGNGVVRSAIRALLAGSRYIVGLAVAATLIGATVILVMAVLTVVHITWDAITAFDVEYLTPHHLDRLGVQFIQITDIILLGTEEQVRLASAAAAELVAGRPVHTHELVVSLRSFIRQVLDLDPIPTNLMIPRQGPARPGAVKGDNKGEGRAQDRGGGRGGNKGMGGDMAAGAGMGLGLGTGMTGEEVDSERS